ncbi:hypothetical protein ETQ85_18335 [Zoogloea oleivorans]|uniref:Restriction endonuclease n=1 Tax=Zoogloea oleivorans TaxID=1552750 RepID=A0A6C2CK46_9RHOO|nr:hypothetical protein [Zoogloea oleivorans]TYC54630.1 hypothetical protein ETQ85_18335 [Zoogloea oleivorans]
MSEVQTSHTLESIQFEFDCLIENLSRVLKEIKPRTNILNTKLGAIKKDLANLDGLDGESLAKITEIAIKYNAINNIFLHKVDYNKHDLAKIIEGKSNYAQDSDESYNDHFFELSMGVRFLLALKEKNPNTKISLDGVCDVIVNDTIAIECKYIHSPSGLVKNVRKAKKQIEERVSKSQAKFGFIALDLSHICPRENIKEFANYTFGKFAANYETLESKGRIKDDILKEILNNNYFYKILSSYISAEIETSLYSELGFSYDLGQKALAIIFQSINSFAFEYKGKVLPLTTRGMTYFLNPALKNKSALDVKKFIHGLAVGV